MKWSKQTWEATLPVYDKILQLPFIGELMNGTLAKEKFLFYIRQDALYLAEFGKVLAGIASKLQNKEFVESFLYFAKDTIQVERNLHESFFKTTGVETNLEASPSCMLYTSYMQRQLACAPVEVAMASVLPCFWIYREVGNYILAYQTKENNQYQSWIDTYGGEEYSTAVDKAIMICDEVAASGTDRQRKAMSDAFILCSKMEWMFWDSAWRLEQWAL